MTTKKILCALAIGMLLVSGMPLFANAQATNDTLVIALQSDMKSMNPWDPDTNDVWKSNQIGWNFEGLMAYNPDFELYPVLAAEKADGSIDATISTDGLTIHVNLKEGVTFTDGVPMTSKDVVFSYQTLGWGLFQTQVLGPLYHKDKTFTRFDGETSHIGVEANGTYGVDFYLAKPYAMFWYLTMAVPISPWHIWTNHTKPLVSADYPKFNVTSDLGWDYSYGSAVTETDATIGTGPMYLESWVMEQGSVLKPYEGYWNKNGTTSWAGKEYPNYPKYVKEMKFKIFTQLDVAILALQNGEVHHLPWSLTPGYYNQLKTDPNIGIETNKDQGFFYMSFNLRKAGIKDVNFRRAISYCVDKQYIVDRLMGGYGIQGSVPMSVTNTFYVNSTVPAWIQGGNLNAAKALLDKEGYTDKDGDGWRDMPDGSPIKFNILTPPKDYDPIRADSGIMIEKNLKSIGLNIAAVPTSFDTIVSAAYVSLDFDMYVLGWSVGSFPESYLRDFFHSESNVAVNPAGSNAAGYENPVLDEMIDEMEVTMDTDDRAQLVKDICGITMNDVAYNTLYYRTNIEAYRKDIWTGWIPAFGTIYNGFSIFNLAPPGTGGDTDGDDGSGGTSTTLSGIEGRMNMPSMAGSGQKISGSIIATDVFADNSKLPSSGATVKITTSTGTTIDATTDANGMASFDLTVPYQRINSVRIDANISKSGVWVNVNKTVDVKFTNHIAKLSLSTADGVIAPGATTNVVATVIDENGNPIAGVNVDVDKALMFGTIDSATKATDANGTATFVYTAPPADMLPNTHRFEQFKANVSVPNTIVPETQSASLIIGISSSLFEWHDIDITGVTAYVIDNNATTSFPNKTNITVKLTDETGAVVPDYYISIALSKGATVIDPDAAMKKTSATGIVTFVLTVDAAYTGSGTVIATFNTSKAYSTKDSVAIFIRNDPKYEMDFYHVNVTSVMPDVIYNTKNTTTNTTTVTVRLYNDTWKPVSGMDVYMYMSNTKLVKASSEFKATNATGYAKFNITCIANGSADLAIAFGVEDSIGISQGYNLKVNKTVATITTQVLNEKVFGPSLEDSKYWHDLVNAPADNAAVIAWNAGVSTPLTETVDYTIDLVTGNISYINTLNTGDSVTVFYNYTLESFNETVFTSLIGGETNLGTLDNVTTNVTVANATICVNNTGAWTPLTETTDYTLNPADGTLTMTGTGYILSIGDVVHAFYNYTTAIANETVFAGPAMSGETGLIGNLDHTPIVNAAIYTENMGVLTLIAPANYTLNVNSGALSLVNALEAGDNVTANYNYTVPHHALSVTSVSSYYIDSNTFSNVTPSYSNIVVRLTDMDGNPQVGKTVKAIHTGDISLVNATAVTNTTGHAKFNVTSASGAQGPATVYFWVNNTAGITESVTLFNGEYKPGYAADIDFTGTIEHNSERDITATVYDEAGKLAPGVPCQFFIPPTAEGIPGVFQGGDHWYWEEYEEFYDMGDWAGYLGSWYGNNTMLGKTVTNAAGVFSATIDTASFIADAAIPLQFGVGGTGVAAAFNYSANNWWMEYYPDYAAPLEDNADVYYWEQADFTLIDQVILFRAPMATLTNFEMDKPFISEADNTTEISLTFQDLAGPLNAKTVNIGQGTANPDILDDGVTTAAGVYTYDYTADVGDFDAGIAFTSVVLDANYAKFPFNFYLPYLTGGTTAQALVVSAEAVDPTVIIGETITLDVMVTDEYDRLVSGATVASGTISATTDATGAAQLTIPTATLTDAGLYKISLDVTKGTLTSDEEANVILLAPEIDMVNIVVGPVLDKDGNPIEGATVSVSLSTGTRQTAYTGLTNATGYATISVPASWLGQTVSVTITKDGYDTITYTTMLNADGTSATAPPAFNEVESGIPMALIAGIIIVILVVVLLVVFVVMPKMKAGKSGGDKVEPKEQEPKEEAEPVPEAPKEPEAPAEAPAPEAPKPEE